MKLLVMRHGETTFNHQRKFYGKTDVSLDETGVKQAEIVSKKLKNESLDAIIRSNMRRTAETAKPIIADHPNADLYVDSGFDEMSFGDWEGMDANQIEAADPQNWQRWLDQPFKVAPGNGESYETFKVRVTQAMTKYYQKLSPASTTLLIAHLGTLRTLYHSWFPSEDYWQTKFEAGCYSVFDLSEDGVELLALNV